MVTLTLMLSRRSAFVHGAKRNKPGFQTPTELQHQPLECGAFARTKTAGVEPPPGEKRFAVVGRHGPILSF